MRSSICILWRLKGMLRFFPPAWERKGENFFTVVHILFSACSLATLKGTVNVLPQTLGPLCGVTWCLHHSLHVLLLQLLDALSFSLAILLQAADFVHILIVQKLQIRCLMV